MIQIASWGEYNWDPFRKFYLLPNLFILEFMIENYVYLAYVH